MDLRRQNPDFTNYRPQTAEDAVSIYYKMKKQNKIPFDGEIRVFQKLASCLNQKEFDIFARWIQNPGAYKLGTKKDPLPSSGYIKSAEEKENETLYEGDSSEEDDEKKEN